MSQQDILDALIQLGAICKTKAVPARTLADLTQNRNATDNIKRLLKHKDIKASFKDGRNYYYLLRGSA